MRIAIIAQEEQPWLSEVTAVLLNYPIELDRVDEGGNTVGKTTISTDKEFGKWCKRLNYCYEIIEEFVTK